MKLEVRWNSKQLVVMAMMTALNIIMADLFKIPVIPRVLELSLGFVPIAMTGMLYGPVAAISVAVVADVIGALIFYPAYFFIGYTFTALMTGLFYGLILHRKDLKLWHIFLCQLLVSAICYATLNSLWAIMLYSKGIEYLTARLVVQPVLYPVYSMVLIVMSRYRPTLERLAK
jgi:riboflavin transporter